MSLVLSIFSKKKGDGVEKMTNCKHFVVRWAGPGNDTSLREKKNQTWGGESHGLKKKKKKKKLIF